MTIEEQKQKLRAEFKLVLQTIPDTAKIQKSKIIIDKLVSDPAFKKAKKILLYASTKNEPDTWFLIDNYSDFQKDFYLPHHKELKIAKIDKSLVLETGNFGISSAVNALPIKGNEVFDLAIVPGLGFDKRGNRLGHGGGWYDRVLATVKAKRKIGLCFKEQVVTALPTATFDIKIDQLLTD